MEHFQGRREAAEVGVSVAKNMGSMKQKNCTSYAYIYIGWWFGTWISFFQSVGNNHPNWLSYFSERLKPPTSIYIYLFIYVCVSACLYICVCVRVCIYYCYTRNFIFLTGVIIFSLSLSLLCFNCWYCYYCHYCSYYCYYYIWTELKRYGYLFKGRMVEFVMDDTYMILYVLMT